MDHMRISGTEPSSMILSQTKYFKNLKNDAQKLPKQAKAKRNGVITHKITISFNYNSENFDALKRYESTEVTVELGYMCPRGLSGKTLNYGTFEIVPQEVLWSIWGSHQTL